MANWFKDHQRVLVYPPGAGGEYITIKYNKQDLFQHYSYSKRAPNRNRYSSHNSFPGHNILFDEVAKLPPITGEWTDECRLNFSNEGEIKKFINKKDPTGEWKKVTGNPDADKVIREYPIGKDKSDKVVFVHNPIWFPTHYDYGVFREPVWKWLDFDDHYWMVHWSLAMFFKDTHVSATKFTTISDEFYWKAPFATWHQERHIYRNYYNQKFPKSRISVDDESFRKDVDYIWWAEKNLEAMEKYLVDNNAIDKINKRCWDYLHNAMPR